MILRVLTTIFAFSIIFCVIVLSHEFGHYIIARVNGIHVREFAIGLGPKLFSFTKFGTEFCVNALPLGGACVFEEEDGIFDEDEDTAKRIEESPLQEVKKGEEGTFSNAPVMARIATVLAGPVFNIVAAYLMALVLVAFCGEITTTIGKVVEGTPAYEAGIRDGDTITKINGSNVYLFYELKLHLITDDQDKFDITYVRDGETYKTVLVPAVTENGRMIGISNPEFVDCRNFKIFEYGWFEIRYWLKATFKSLKMLLTGKLSKDDVSGPVGMAQIVDSTIETTKQYGLLNVVLNLLNLAVLLSVNLGIMNLLPIPALDGGRLLFLIAELVTRRKLPRKAEMVIQIVGFTLLLVISGLVLFNDITKFFR